MRSVTRELINLDEVSEKLQEQTTSKEFDASSWSNSTLGHQMCDRMIDGANLRITASANTCDLP